MSPLRLLYALQGFPPRQNGGTEWETYRRARWLIANGHEAHVVAVDRKTPSLPHPIASEQDRVDGIPITRLSVDTPNYWGDRGEYDDPLIHQALRSNLLEVRPDILHIASGFQMTAGAIRAGMGLGIPVLLTATDFWLVCPRLTLRKGTGELCNVPDDPLVCVSCLSNDWRRYRLPHLLTGGASSRALQLVWRHPRLRPPGIDRIHTAMVDRRAVLPSALDGVERVIVASQFLADTLSPRVVPTEKTIVMRQGLDMDDWLPVVPIERTTLHFGYIGQISEHKGLFDVIEAYLRLADDGRKTRLIIFGDHEGAWPETRERLLNLIVSRPDIELMGRFDNREIRQIHAQLDVLVVPSRWYENSPNVILEAFACRTPVITSRLGGMAELVEDGVTGWLVPPGDVAALATCMAAIADDPEVLIGVRDRLPPVRTIDEEMSDLVRLYEETRRS